MHSQLQFISERSFLSLQGPVYPYGSVGVPALLRGLQGGGMSDARVEEAQEGKIVIIVSDLEYKWL